MAQKKPNLAEVAAAAGSVRRPAATAVAVPEPPEPGRVRSRTGTKQIAAHLPEDVSWQLRALAVQRRTTVQDLLGEALNDLFAKYGKPEIAPISQSS